MDGLWDTVREFLLDYSEYLPNKIPELEKIPTANRFLSDYVLTNLPFIVRCGESDCFPAVELWKDHEYLREKMEKKTVTIAVTPDGYADSIVDNRFMIPEERTMLFEDFFDELHKREPDMQQVYYVQKQNNNLVEEFSPLVGDVVSHVPWATEAFGSLPDAANIWMGDHRSVTSLHKDHYENIYYVITGHKQFHLYPPVAWAWMPYEKCKKFQWFFKKTFSPGEWQMKDLNEEVEWILPSHKPEALEKIKLCQNTKSYILGVNPGDVLYIPAMWLHDVKQIDDTIAVNYWYDMKYDMKYPFLKLLTKLCNMPDLRRTASVDIQTELKGSLIKDLEEKQENAVKDELIRREHTHKHVRK